MKLRCFALIKMDFQDKEQFCHFSSNLKTFQNKQWALYWSSIIRFKLANLLTRRHSFNSFKSLSNNKSSLIFPRVLWCSRWYFKTIGSKWVNPNSGQRASKMWTWTFLYLLLTCHIKNSLNLASPDVRTKISSGGESHVSRKQSNKEGFSKIGNGLEVVRVYLMADLQASDIS